MKTWERDKIKLRKSIPMTCFLLVIALFGTVRDGVAQNWYPTLFIKVYSTFERTIFESNVPRPPENVILFRTQLGF